MAVGATETCPSAIISSRAGQIPRFELITMRRIAVDAMGTDSAPEAELEGAIQAARAGYAEVLLVGPQDRLSQELSQA